jgi:hypothetical protein
MELKGLSKPRSLKFTCLPNNRSAANVLGLQNSTFPHSSSFFIIYSCFLFIFLLSHFFLTTLNFFNYSLPWICRGLRTTGWVLSRPIAVLCSVAAGHCGTRLFIIMVYVSYYSRAAGLPAQAFGLLHSLIVGEDTRR